MIYNTFIFTHDPKLQEKWIKDLKFLLSNRIREDLEKLKQQKELEPFREYLDGEGRKAASKVVETAEDLKAKGIELKENQAKMEKEARLMLDSTLDEYFDYLIGRREKQNEMVQEALKGDNTAFLELIDKMIKNEEDFNWPFAESDLFVENGKLYILHSFPNFKEEMRNAFKLCASDLKPCYNFDEVKERVKEVNTVLTKKESTVVKDLFTKYPDSIVKFFSVDETDTL